MAVHRRVPCTRRRAAPPSRVAISVSFRRCTLAQGASHHLHPAQQSVVICAHTQMLMAARVQRARRCSRPITEFWNVKGWLIEILLSHALKPSPDRRVLSLRSPIFANLAAAKAIHQGFNQPLFTLALNESD